MRCMGINTFALAKADKPATISMIYWCVCRPGRGVKLKCMLLNPDRKKVFWTRVYLSYSHASVQPKKENKTQTVCCWHPLQVALFILYHDCGMISLDEWPPGQLMLWQEDSLPSKQSKTLCCLHRFSKEATITTYTPYHYPHLDLHEIFWNRHVPKIFHKPNTPKKPKRTLRGGF